MTKRGLNLGKYRVGSGRVDRVDPSIGRSVGRIDREDSWSSSSRAHRWFHRSVRWSRSGVSFVRASVFGRTRDDEPSDGARGGNGTVTGETT